VNGLEEPCKKKLNYVQVLVAGMKLEVGWIIISSKFYISVAVCGLPRFRIPDVAQLGS
jgi:hypothetical protein